MSKRTIIILAVIIWVLTVIAAIFIAKQNIGARAASYEAIIAKLQQTAEKWGSDVTVYTVQATVKAGDPITAESIQTITIPSAVDSEQYVKSLDLIVDEENPKYFKIALSSGTILTNDMIMDYKLTEDMRDVDIKLTSFTVGLNDNDYMDIYFTAPYGDRYLVLPKLKIQKINGDLIKVYLTTQQRHILAGAYVDYYLNKDYGALLTGERYIEPGLQSEAIAYYAVPENINDVMKNDPNIPETLLDNINSTAQLRDQLNKTLDIFRDNEDTVDTDTSKLNENREDLTSAINDKNEEIQDAKAENGGQVTTEDNSGDDLWGDDDTTTVTTTTGVDAVNGQAAALDDTMSQVEDSAQ